MPQKLYQDRPLRKHIISLTPLHLQPMMIKKARYT